MCPDQANLKDRKEEPAAIILVGVPIPGRAIIPLGVIALLLGCGRSSVEPFVTPALSQGGMFHPQQTIGERRNRSDSNEYDVLFRFPSKSGACPNGAWPQTGLVADNKLLYGTTYAGGAYGDGAAFSITKLGTQRVLFSFEHVAREGDGGGPEGSLVAVKGTLYGTTPEGGKYGKGTVFSLSLGDARERVLHSFGGKADGATPEGGLSAIDQVLYGTTLQGGKYREGTVFSISRDGTNEKVLHSFGSGSDGQAPQASVIAFGGALFGTTVAGGAFGSGTVFTLSESGAGESVLHSFGRGVDGAQPEAPLTASNGLLFGTTAAGGSYSKSGYGGTLFSIQVSGGEQVLHSFGNGLDGQEPSAPVLVYNDTLYGTTARGGEYASSGSTGGTIYSYSVKSGTEKILHSFGHGSDGSLPMSPLIASNGALYGTTFLGGGIYSECVTSGETTLGTVFRVKP